MPLMADKRVKNKLVRAMGIMNLVWVSEVIQLGVQS